MFATYEKKRRGKRIVAVALLVCVSVLSIHGAETSQEKAEALLRKMTLEEKVGQMVQVSSGWDLTGPVPDDAPKLRRAELIKTGQVGSMLNVTGAAQTREAQRMAVENSRLGIPLIFGYDVIHGYQTTFPIPLGLAAAWEPEIVAEAARIAAVEASSAGIHWTFAPMVDVSRDPRWGRVMEAAGEDTYLNTVMAAAAVRGYQGEDLWGLDTIVACAKHFAGYGFTVDGKDYNTAMVDEATLRDVVLPPFKACVDAGALSFMNGFHTLNGVPVTADAGLVRGILKGEWDFEGLVLSDWRSIDQLIPHGVAADKREAVRLAFAAGCDMDMMSMCYTEHLADLVRTGAVSEELVDDAVLRVLRVKYKLGLFEDPYRYSDEAREAETLGKAAHHEAAREAARRSIVLLRNQDDLLPLDIATRVAVIGPLADDKDSPLGNWRAQAIPDSAVSLLEGVRAVNPETLFAKGCELFIKNDSVTKSDLIFNLNDRSGFTGAKRIAAAADVVLLAIGEDAYESGEARSKTNLELKGLQLELLDEILSVNPNVVVVLSHGRPMVISSWAERVPAILATWQLGSQSGHAIADVVFGDYNPSGRLPMSFPRSQGQIPVYYNHLNTGRPAPKEGSLKHTAHYLDEANDPLYPFGYGLSYTEFAYSSLTVDVSGTLPDTVVEVNIEVTNTGERDGEEVVQLYINDPVASRARPVRELKRFRKVLLRQAESQTVTFRLTADDLAFWTINRRMETEPGHFKLLVGDLQDEFRITGRP
jgi:beta-glucosidase